MGTAEEASDLKSPFFFLMFSMRCCVSQLSDCYCSGPSEQLLLRVGFFFYIAGAYMLRNDYFGSKIKEELSLLLFTCEVMAFAGVVASTSNKTSFPGIFQYWLAENGAFFLDSQLAHLCVIAIDTVNEYCKQYATHAGLCEASDEAKTWSNSVLRNDFKNLCAFNYNQMVALDKLCLHISS